MEPEQKWRGSSMEPRQVDQGDNVTLIQPKTEQQPRVLRLGGRSCGDALPFYGKATGGRSWEHP